MVSPSYYTHLQQVQLTICKRLAAFSTEGYEGEPPLLDELGNHTIFHHHNHEL